MDDNKVAVLLEQLSSQFQTFGEGLQNVQAEVTSLTRKTDGLIEDMDVVKPTLNRLIEDMDVVKHTLTKVDSRLDSLEHKTDELIEDMDIVKPTLIKVNDRLDNIESEMIKLNPESCSVLKQIK